MRERMLSGPLDRCVDDPCPTFRAEVPKRSLQSSPTVVRPGWAARTMRGSRIRRARAVIGAGLLVTAGAAACERHRPADDGKLPARVGDAPGAAVGVIMPTKTGSRRWLTGDPPALKAAFDAAG